MKINVYKLINRTITVNDSLETVTGPAHSWETAKKINFMYVPRCNEINKLHNSTK